MGTSQLSYSAYYRTRFAPDPRREILWQSLVQYHFSKLIRPTDCVLELGAGYGHFINNVTAARKLALDVWEDFAHCLNPGIDAHVGPVDDLHWVPDNSVDFVFASNLFEHVPQIAFTSVLEQLTRKLKPGGTINLLQPNYRYAYREYFDDYTHVTVYSDISLCDFLSANNYEVIENQPRFMPLTIKSRFRVSPLLIRAYLMSPVKPMGKQMFIRARPSRNQTALAAAAK
jgi:ubiquinone/menaquinone biosynthesis C-methylase UbiE